MNTVKPQENAGYRYHRRNPITAEPVAVYCGEAQQVDTTDGRWIVVCEAHCETLTCETISLAKSAAREPEEWCEACREAHQWRHLSHIHEGMEVIARPTEGGTWQRFVVAYNFLASGGYLGMEAMGPLGQPGDHDDYEGRAEGIEIKVAARPWREDR